MFVGLKINGIEVAPLIEAEIRRLHPVVNDLKPTTADGVRKGFGIVYDLWAKLVARAHELDEALVHERVGDEWSFVETLRHLVFATDAWILRVVADDPEPYHPLGLPPPFWEGVDVGRDTDADPMLAEVVAVRADREARVRGIVDALTDADLDRMCEPSTAGMPPGAHKLGDALRTILSEEYWHYTYAVRDLDSLTAPG